MARKLYDLAAADPDRRFSPYCWRSKFALAHKGLDFETVPWRFTEREALAFSGQGRVPVLVDGERVVFDSWTIANYLEDAYPDRPSLFGGEGGRAATRFVNSWADTVLNLGIIRVVLLDIHEHLNEQDRVYFRESREKRFGVRLEDVVTDRPAKIAALRASLEPLRAMLAGQPYLGGQHPLYADFIVLGSFQWARCISPVPLLEPGDPVFAWRERMLDALDGVGRRALAYAA